jgi:predicted amidophosphoribosyltransferase
MVLVIDDVCTTGASLIYAGKFLKDAGSGEVTRLAVSMNIGNVLYD